MWTVQAANVSQRFSGRIPSNAKINPSVWKNSTALKFTRNAQRTAPVIAFGGPTAASRACR